MIAMATALILGVVVDAEALLDSIVASVVAGVIVTFSGSMAIYGIATFGEMRRQGRVGGMVGAGAIAATFSIAFIGAIVVGLIVMVVG